MGRGERLLTASAALPLQRRVNTPSSRDASAERALELHPIRAFEPEQLPRFVRRGDLVAEILDDAADFGDLLSIAFGELARADIERVLKADAHIAAEHRGRGAKIHLMAAAGQHRPQIIVAE